MSMPAMPTSPGGLSSPFGNLAMSSKPSSPLKRQRDDLSDEVECIGERTMEQRNAELRERAVDLEAEEYASSLEPVHASSSPPQRPTPARVKAESPEDKSAAGPSDELGQRTPEASPRTPEDAWRVADAALLSVRLPPPRQALDADQLRALDVALAGRRNLFLTGGAGVGKSFTLNAIVAHLIAKFGVRAVAVTATTGCASVHIDGQTLHSLTGLGVPQHVNDFGRLFKAGGGQKAQAWKEMRVLVIDEISMLDAEFFDYLSIAVDRCVNYTEVAAAEEASDGLLIDHDGLMIAS